MPQFTVVTREKYAHRTTYEVEAETAEEAVQMVKENKVEDYESTEIDGYDPADELLAVLEVSDENGNEFEVPKDPEPNCTRLTFEIITDEIWDEAAITALAEDFQNRYIGNVAIDSACLDTYENVYVEPYVDDNHDDDDDD